MFSIGDKVVHPMHGAGIIRNIVKQKIDGEVRDYFELEMAAGEMRVLVPCSNGMGGIRKIMSSEEADEVLEKLSEEQENGDMSWNKRYRENIIKIKSGDPFKVAGVIKSLVTRDKEKALSLGERKLLNSAKQIAASEISFAKNISYQEAENMLDAALV